MIEGHFQEPATFVHLLATSLLIIPIVYFIKHILFVISSNIIESALRIFPSLLLPSSHLILEKHKKICTPCSLLGTPGVVWAQAQVERVCTRCVRSRDSAGCRQVAGTLG